MEYKILRIDDRGTTATVEMNVQGRILVQDFPLGDSAEDLKKSIKQGLEVLKAETKAREAEAKDIGEYNALIDKTIKVKGETT